MAIASNVFPENKVGSAMGLIGSMSAIGTGSGPVLGGLIVDNLNWQIIFLINIPFGLLIFILGLKYLPKDKYIRASNSESIDLFGFFILFITILTYTVSIKLTGNGLDSTNVSLLIIFLSCLSIFVFFQRKSNAPLIKFSMLKENNLIPSLICNFIISAVVMSSLVIGPFYLTLALELNNAEAGLGILEQEYK